MEKSSRNKNSRITVEVCLVHLVNPENVQKSSRNENSRITVEVVGVQLVNLEIFGARVSECSL